MIFSCSKKENDLIVKGTVKGLKKGTIYLQKVSDTTLMAVDSVSILGDSSFELHSELDTPEMYYLYLDKNDNSENRISFFADKGTTEINTTLKNFVFDANIVGSKQQEVLLEYNKMIKQFNNKSLDLIKANFEAQKEQDQAMSDSLKGVLERYNSSRFKYALNFTMSHLDSEVTPYIVLTDMYNANIKVLDTIYNNLDTKVLNSKYGIELKNFIENVKFKEKTE
jgi:succinate dehydrogenase flavin-adding protein (antitoxin of CptAB toxin-antitoxin module)